jgi:hypothetical protein
MASFFHKSAKLYCATLQIIVPLSVVFGQAKCLDNFNYYFPNGSSFSELIGYSIIGAGIGGVAGVIYPISIPLYIIWYNNEKMKTKQKEINFEKINTGISQKNEDDINLDWVIDKRN